MRTLSGAMESATLDRMQTWKSGEKINLLEEMQVISLDVIIRAVLGIQDPELSGRFRIAIREGIRSINLANAVAIALFAATGGDPEPGS